MADEYASLTLLGHDDEQDIFHFYESVEGIAHIEACSREYFPLCEHVLSILRNHVGVVGSAHHHECAEGIGHNDLVEEPGCYAYARLMLLGHVDVWDAFHSYENAVDISHIAAFDLDHFDAYVSVILRSYVYDADSAHSHENDQGIDQHQVEVWYYAYDRLILHRRGDESGNAHGHVNVWDNAHIPAHPVLEEDHIDAYVSLIQHNHGDV